MNLYPQLLGDAFADVPPILQRFHSTLPAHAMGLCRVHRADRGVTGLIARLMRLPPSGRSVALRLEVSAHGGGERWERSFAGQPLITTQHARGTVLIERIGVIRFEFALACERGRMIFRLRRASCCGIRLPKRLRPHVRATVSGRTNGWIAKVIVRSSWGTTLVRYRAEVKPQCITH
jgi:hypothetical protein